MKIEKADWSDAMFRLIPWFIMGTFIFIIGYFITFIGFFIFGAINVWDMGLMGVAEYLGELAGKFSQGMNK